MGPEDSVGMVRGSVIEIHAYHDLWPAEFARVRDELISVLPDWAHEIHHVGSTSIPGLAAKPIIDILVGVPSLERARDELVEPIERLGFLYRSDDDLPDRHYCPRTVAGLRRHHVSMAVPTSRHFRNTLIFRDALRGTPGLAVEYETLKRRLAANVGEDRLSYLNGKTDFILSVLAAHGGVVGGDYPMRDLGRG